MPIRIDVCEELTLASIAFTQQSGTEVRCSCPFHGDKTPSCDISLDKAMFICRSCKARGHIAKLLARVTDKAYSLVLAALNDKYGEGTDKPIEATLIEKWHTGIWNNEHLLAELHKRAVTDSIIRAHRLGVDRGRITIPIRNSQGTFVNVRRYKPGASSGKFASNSGRGQARIYPFDQLEHKKILLCGGELKALVAADQINAYGYGAVAIAGAEGTWSPTFNDYFRDKTVYICMDVDKAGIAASKSLCAQIHNFAEATYEVILPIDIEKGDLNDFVAGGGQLLDLLVNCEKWEPIGFNKAKLAPVSSPLSGVLGEEGVHKRFEVRACVAAIDESTYTVPRTVRVHCDRDQGNCGDCPVPLTQDSLLEIDAEAPAVLEMMETPDVKLHAAMVRGLGIPKCKPAKYSVESYYSAVEARLQQEIDVTDSTSDSSIIPVVFVSCDAEVNGTYKIVGTSVPNPKSQRVTLVASSSDAVADAVTGFVLLDGEELEKYRPDEWTVEGVTAKLDHLYHDLACNVTRIYQRPEMHAVVDLTYFSVLSMNFDGKPVKGYLDTLVIGDSSQGKTETFLGLQGYYKLGERVDCKNATRAGLLGGVEQLAGKHFVTWGIIPRHDGRLVALEEIKGMAPEVLASLTDMRSSGVAEIPKIRHGKALARARLVAFTNPKSSLPMCSYGFGVDAVKELVPGLEDIRRFDVVCIVDKEDVDSEAIQMQRPTTEHVYDCETGRRLVLWAWTRSVDQVKFIDDAETVIRASAKYLCSRYCDELPLLDRGSARFKLARLATAVAARTFSASEDTDLLLVRPCHVQWATKFLDKMYSAPSHGYKRYSEHVDNESRLADDREVRQLLLKVTDPKALITRLTSSHKIEPQDVADWNNWDRVEAQDFISGMVRNNAFKRVRRYYVKTAALNVLFAEMAADGSLNIPDYITDAKKNMDML